MKQMTFVLIYGLSLVLTASAAFGWFGGKFQTLKPENGIIAVPADTVSDGKVHYFQTRSDTGIMVKFFLIKSTDGVIRAAVDACDVCYKSGKGYVQDGNVMVCTNCNRRFAADRINEIKGGCNPAPLERRVENGRLLISMEQINANAWYCEFK